MKRVLVIGAKGMLGRDLLEALRSARGDSTEDFEVIGWDIEEIDIRQEAGTALQDRRTTARHRDQSGSLYRCRWLREKPGRGLPGQRGRDEACRQGGQRSGAKVVYLSTDYVFDGKKREPYLETDPPNPLNVYGQTKLKGEEYLQKWAEDHLIIRTQWLYGRHGKNFVSSILRLAKEKPDSPIVDDQTGSPTYTVDLSRAIAACSNTAAAESFTRPTRVPAPGMHLASPF